TADLLHAMQALSQLSYTPVPLINPFNVFARNLLFKARFLLFRCRFCLVPLAKKRDYARTKFGVQVASWQKTKKLRKKRDG
ncbi:hypothetical protein, partial [Achromobacter mucicolens]|uniref:hypothetical protein n=1 Tax=Achromobacter mucicolens TaxID=1389922 RepID=UPI002FE365F7